VTVSVTVGETTGQAQVGPEGLLAVDKRGLDMAIGLSEPVDDVSKAVVFCHFGW
jgi:hypothetical protein